VLPKQVQEELAGAEQHFSVSRHCLFCDILDQECDGERWILEANGFVALSPYAARFPFETWIMPRRHAAHFEDLTSDDRAAVASILQQVLRRLQTHAGNPPYNMVIHTAPCKEHNAHEYYHWHIEIMPKLTQPAGFEWGSGFHINPMSPEEATRILRAP
jgi:UDPglucose--hexose-1-phosphate uridylyltransferase